MNDLLMAATRLATRYLEGIRERRVSPDPASLEGLRRFYLSLPEEPLAPQEVLYLLDSIGSPATVATTGGRYFGFVIGGTLPTALAANWLAGAWDQNAGIVASSPAAAAIEEVVTRWIIELFDLPASTGVGFVTGATMANFTCLAAARHALLTREGWDVEAKGLFGAPPITVVVGQEVHVSLLKALSLLGLGRDRVVRVPTDGKGRMRTDNLPRLSGPTILCLQAGNVNTGAFDPAGPLCEWGHAAKAWVHVDGAFGLWAAASRNYRHLMEGFSLADSWATDSHKWLNVPYDSGLAIVFDAQPLRAAMVAAPAAYLTQHEEMREPDHYTPELSRRGRGIEIWAALLSLGRSGLSDLVERCCRHATRFAEGLKTQGWEILNDVVLNQVLAALETDAATQRAIARIQSDGTCWCGPTNWRGRVAMRISVSSWATRAEDVERSLEAMSRARGT